MGVTAWHVSRPSRSALAPSMAHTRRVPLALTLALRLLLTAGDCYFVTNTRILVLPTCDVSPDTIDALTEDPGPSRASAVPPRPAAWAARRGQPWRPQPPVATVGTKELESKLRDEQERRIAEVARRLAAEQQRDAALRERDRALTKLADLARELAAGRARTDRRTPALTDATPRGERGSAEPTTAGPEAPRGTRE